MYVLFTYRAMYKYIPVSNLTDSGGLSCLHHMVPGTVICCHVLTTMFQLVVWFGGRLGVVIYSMRVYHIFDDYDGITRLPVYPVPGVLLPYASGMEIHHVLLSTL